MLRYHFHSIETVHGHTKVIFPVNFPKHERKKQNTAKIVSYNRNEKTKTVN